MNNPFVGERGMAYATNPIAGEPRQLLSIRTGTSNSRLQAGLRLIAGSSSIFGTSGTFQESTAAALTSAIPSDGDMYTFAPGNDGWLRLLCPVGQGQSTFYQTETNPRNTSQTITSNYAGLSVGNLRVNGTISGPGAPSGGGGQANFVTSTYSPQRDSFSASTPVIFSGSVTISTTGSPVLIIVTSDCQPQNNTGEWVFAQIYRNGSPIGTPTTIHPGTAPSTNQGFALHVLDNVVPGTYTYNARGLQGSGTIRFNENNNGTTISAFELASRGPTGPQGPPGSGGSGGGTSNWVRAYHTSGGGFNGNWIPPNVDSNNTSGIYNSSTGVYTCPSAGWYTINFYVQHDTINQSSTTTAYVTFLKNNSQFQRYYSRPLAGVYSGTATPYSGLAPYHVITGHELVYCNTNDQLRLYMSCYNLFANGANGAPGFSIYKIS